MMKTTMDTRKVRGESISMPSVLFICTANICRSPMAAYLFKTRLGDEAEHWRVESAGTWAPEGQPAARNTLQVLQKFGSDASSHRARMVTPELLDQFNLIITMEKGHKEALLSEFPGISGRIYSLTEIAGEIGDVRDPIGGPLVDFEDMACELDLLFTKGMARIRQLAQGAV